MCCCRSTSKCSTAASNSHCLLPAPQSGAQCSQHNTCRSPELHCSLTFNTVTRNTGQCYSNSMSICITSTQRTGLSALGTAVPYLFSSYGDAFHSVTSHTLADEWHSSALHINKHDRNNFQCLQHFATSGHTTSWSQLLVFRACRPSSSAAKLRPSLHFIN